MEDSPAAGPGEVRHGFAVGELDEVVVTPSGVACLTCGVLFYFGGDLRETSRAVLGLAGRTGRLAVAGETMIVLDQNQSSYSYEDDQWRPPDYQLFARGATGDELWRDDLGVGAPWNTGARGAGYYDGPVYPPPEIATGPEVVVVSGRSRTTVLDAASGQQRWDLPATPGYAVAADAHGGLFIAGDASEGVSPHASLRHHTSDGSVEWTTSWASPDTGTYGGVAFTGAARTANDGVIVAGDFTMPTLNLGGPVLHSPTGPVGPNSAAFVAALDDHGATRWAVSAGTRSPVGYVQTRQIVATADGALLCGEYAGGSQLGLPATDGSISLFVARVDAHGAIWAYPISGRAVFCRGLAAAADGSAVVTVSSSNAQGSAMITVGGHVFDEGPESTNYVLNIAL